MTAPLSLARKLCTGLLALGIPAAAFAQPPDSTPPASQSPLVLERIDNRLVIAPDVRFTQVNDRDATLVGGTVGWLMDKTFMVGGGFYFLGNRDDEFKMDYGGLVVEYTHWGDRAVSFGLRGLVGGGTATLSDTFAYATVPLPSGGRQTSNRPGGMPGYGPPGAATYRYIFEDTYFIFEPQVSVRVRLVDWASLEGGVGYRVIGAEEGFNDRLDGVSGTVGIRMGIR